MAPTDECMLLDADRTKAYNTLSNRAVWYAVSNNR